VARWAYAQTRRANERPTIADRDRRRLRTATASHDAGFALTGLPHAQLASHRNGTPYGCAIRFLAQSRTLSSTRKGQPHLVGEGGFEPPTSCPQSRRAAGCATPRESLFAVHATWHCDPFAASQIANTPRAFGPCPGMQTEAPMPRGKVRGEVQVLARPRCVPFR
jgi:hypothetical protein